MLYHDAIEKDEKITHRNYLIAGIAGVVGGVITAAVAIRREFDQDIANQPLIKQLREEVGSILKGTCKDTSTIFEKAKPLVAKLSWSAEDLTQSDVNAKREAYLSTIAKIKGVYHRQERTILEGLGYRSHGWQGLVYGTIDRTRQMSKESRSVIFLSSAVSVGFLTGAMATFLNNRHTGQKITELSAKLDAQDAEKASGRG